MLVDRMVVGAGDDDDITVADPELVPKHFTIVLDDGAVSLVVGETAVVINGELRSNSTFRIAPFDLIKFGTTTCAIGPQGKPWPQFDAAALLPVPISPPAASSEPAIPEIAEEPLPKASALGRLRTRTGLLATSAALLLIAVLSVGYWLFAQSSPARSSEFEALKAAQEIVAQQQLSGVAIRTDEAAGLIAEGFVESNEQQRRLRQALGDARLPVKVRVASLEQQVTAIRTIVATAGARLTVASDPSAGKITLKGFLPEVAHLEALQRIMARDVPDLRPIDARIITMELAHAEIRDQLAAAGLAGSLRTERSGSTVKIEGSLPESGRAALQQLVDNLNLRWPGDVKVEIATMPASPPVTVLAGPIERITVVVSGPNGFIRDGAGRRFTIGEKLANGEIIEEIRIDEVVTSKDGTKHRYTFGRR
jgi:type III secretion system YscD/HrpQ family protein